MIDIKVNTDNNNFRTALPTSFVLSRKAFDDISEIFRADIEQNIISGTGLDGKGLKAKKNGGRLLYHTGRLSQSVKRKTFIREAQIFISSPASYYAKYVNVDRTFFGQSNRSLIKIDKYLITTKQEELFDKRFT